MQLVLHAWAVAPIADGPVIQGAIFESKEGRQAIRARVVVDASGDADLFARAGAALDSDIDERDIHHCTNTAWLFGGVDMDRWIAFRTGDPKGFSDFMARGPRARSGSSRSRSSAGATTWRSSWGRGCPATAPSTWRT